MTNEIVTLQDSVSKEIVRNFEQEQDVEVISEQPEGSHWEVIDDYIQKNITVTGGDYKEETSMKLQADELFMLFAVTDEEITENNKNDGDKNEKQ